MLFPPCVTTTRAGEVTYRTTSAQRQSRTWENPMARFLAQLEQAAFKRVFEQLTQPILEEAIASNLHPNTAAKRVIRKIITIPGFGLAANVLFSTGGELLSEHADELWPGDTRPFTKALREILKRTGPLIVGASDATADALEKLGDASVDQVVSPSTVAGTGRASMDALFFFHHEGVWRLILPARNPGGGQVVMDEWGNPVPINAEVLAAYNHEDYTKPTSRQEKGKDGKPGRTVKGPPAKKRMVIGPLSPLEAAEQNLFDLKRFPLEEAEALRKLLTPKPSWESRVSPRVDHVLSWLVDVLSFAPLNLTALERQEVEDLVQKMKARKPDPDWVNRRLGRFEDECAKFPLTGRRTYNEAAIGRMRTLFGRIRNEIDITLEGEQSNLTKARKGLQAAPDVLRQVGEILTTSTPWAVQGLLWWRNATIAAFVFLLAGILMPVAWANLWWVTMGTMLVSLAGGIIGFATTWPFPVVQKAYDWLQKYIGGTSVDSINSLGRRIASFALLVGAGILPLLIWLQFPIVVRVGIVAFGGLVPIGIVFALREAGYPDLAQKMAKRSILIANFVFGTIAVGLFALVGFMFAYTGKLMTGPSFVRWFVDGSLAQGKSAETWFSGLSASAATGVVAVVMGLVVLAALFFLPKKEKASVTVTTVKPGESVVLNFASIVLGGLAFLGVLVAVGWLGFKGLSLVGNWFEDPAPSASTAAEAPTQQDNGPWFDKAGMCADPDTTFEQRQTLKCP
ncbi:hypothetical protein HY630_00425 [Candidatus Uhrbacteria bacterium]|nr:hypothetical protein [Candidatus Uhrbacteria bacterium]